MSNPIHEIERIFAPEGPLAAAVAGFRPRPQQLEMAQRIAAAIAGNLAPVAEAGTGTGKTFAYLAPALLSGGKVIVSTGTNTPQDQLFNRDLIPHFYDENRMQSVAKAGREVFSCDREKFEEKGKGGWN